MLALATTRAGDVPLYCHALDGNARDQVSLVAAVEALAQHLRGDLEEAPILVADSGLYSAENVARLAAAGVRWISRVPDTSTEARAALEVADDGWQQEGTLFWAGAAQAPAGERWVVARTTSGEERARATLQRQVEQAHQTWEKQLWHLSTQRFACEPDAQAALAQQLKKCPVWLVAHSRLIAHPKQNRPGRPRTGTPPDRAEWQVEASVAVEAEAVTRAVQRTASFLVATNVLDAAQLADQDLIQTYTEQHSVERGFSFPSGSAVSGLLGLRQKAQSDRRAQPRHGALSVGVPARGASAPRAARRRRPDGAQPAQPADGSSHHALDVPVLRRHQPGGIPVTQRAAAPRHRWPAAAS